MTFTRRHLCLALLVALLIGHVGVAVHAATHVSGDAADCELCSSFSNTAHATADPERHAIPDARHLFALPDPAAAPNARSDALYQPRGPPPLN